MYDFFGLIIMLISVSLDTKKHGKIVTVFLPKNILYVFILVFYYLPVYSEIIYIQNLINKIDINYYSTRISVLNFIVVILLHFLNQFFKISSKKGKEKQSHLHYDTGCNLVVIGYLSFLILISWDLLKPLLSGLSSSSLSMNLRNGGSLRFFTIASCEIIPLILLLFNKKKHSVVLVLTLLLSSILITCLGARSLVLSMFFSMILYYISTNKINKFIVFTILLLGIVTFFSTTQNRSKFSIVWQFLSRNLDQYNTTMIVMEKIDRETINYQYGTTIIDAFYFMTPSVIMTDKPKSYRPSRLVFPEIIYNGIAENTKHTINFGILARGYLELGFFGVILSIIIYMKLFNHIYGKIIQNNFNSRNKKFFYIMAYSHVVQFLLLGVTSHVYCIILLNYCYYLVLINNVKLISPVRENLVNA